MRLETVKIDGVGQPLPWFDPTSLTEVEQSQLQRLLAWSYDTSQQCYRVRRKAPHKVGRVAYGSHLFAVVPDLSAGDFTTFFLYSIGVDISRFAHHKASPITAALGDEHLDYDTLVATLMALTCEEIASGYLSRGYEKREENLYVLKGRIDWVKGFVRPRHQGLPCSYYEITSDNLLNRIILEGLSVAKRLDLPPALQQRLSKLEFMWSSVCRRQHIQLHDLRACEAGLNRLTESYRPALALSRMLLFGYVPDDFFGGDNSTLQCVEFDLAVIFERFVRQLLRFRFASTDFEVLFQESADNELLDDTGGLYQAARPDFLIARKGESIVVLDAKFKPRYVSLAGNERFSGKNKVDEADVYQMLFYADRVKRAGSSSASTAVVIAPKIDSAAVLPPEFHRRIIWRRGRVDEIRIEVLDVDLPATIAAIRGESAFPDDGLAKFCDQLISEADLSRELPGSVSGAH